LTLASASSRNYPWNYFPPVRNTEMIMPIPARLPFSMELRLVPISGYAPANEVLNFGGQPEIGRTQAPQRAPPYYCSGPKASYTGVDERLHSILDEEERAGRVSGTVARRTRGAPPQPRLGSHPEVDDPGRESLLRNPALMLKEHPHLDFSVSERLLKENPHLSPVASSTPKPPAK
jgi:hypothetical protein